VATFGAPGVGQAWECANGHQLAQLYGALIDQAAQGDGEPPWVLGPGDVI
jgi:hypothetical protein